MIVKKFKSDKEVKVNINKYRIDWENDGASKLERQFRDLIYNYWKSSIVLYQYRIPGSLLRVDFINCNKKIAVEIQGPQHNKFNPFFHNNSQNNFVQSFKRDLDKYEWLQENDFKILELTQEDLNWFSPSRIDKNFGINII